MTTHKNKRRDALTALPAGNRGAWIAGISLLAAVSVVSFGWWCWATKRTNESPGSAPPIEARAATTPAAAAAPQADFQRLKGKWLRPDGGYVIEVKSVDAGGRMEASYFNPQPIRVAKAEAAQNAGALKVFVELRDVNYPGSTYYLTYDPHSDSLKGIYYQAALQQRFEVVFVRTN